MTPYYTKVTVWAMIAKGVPVDPDANYGALRRSVEWNCLPPRSAGDRRRHDRTDEHSEECQPADPSQNAGRAAADSRCVRRRAITSTATGAARKAIRLATRCTVPLPLGPIAQLC